MDISIKTNQMMKQAPSLPAATVASAEAGQHVKTTEPPLTAPGRPTETGNYEQTVPDQASQTGSGQVDRDTAAVNAQVDEHTAQTVEAACRHGRPVWLEKP